MSTYKSIRTHWWSTLLVLMYLVATLLPASATAVSAQATNCPEQSIQSATVADFVVPAANQQVEVPKETVNKAAIIAYWNMDLGSSLLDVPHIVLNSFLLYSDLQEGTDRLNEFRDRYTAALNARSNVSHAMGKIGYDDIVHTMLNVALDMPELAPHVPNVWKKLSEYDYTQFYQDPKNRVASSAYRYTLNDGAVKLAESLLIEIYDCAQENPEVAEAFDELHQEKYNVSIRDSARTVFDRNPNLPFMAEINAKLGDDGTLSISLDQLKELSQTEFDKLHITLDQMQETLVEIDEQQDVIIDYLKDQELKAKWQELAKKKAEEYQFKLDAIKSSISLLSTLVGYINPRSAKEISVLGNATLQMGVAVNGWIKATAGLNSLDKVTSMSTMAMTGNVLGALMNIVSLFGNGQPTPEQMILEEIGKLRQQVNQLRTEMHDRFDRIDVGLNAIYTTMYDRFNQIDIQLGKINGNILEVQQSLVGLDLKLSRIERNNFEFINALGRRPLLEAINGGLGYGQRTGELMPYQPEFVNFENQLQSWGTVHAFDPINAGPTQRNYSDAQLLAELSTYPLDANINYINGWMAAHGLPAITNKPLPSPRDWLFASRAYTQLGLEWPQHMKRIDPQRQAELHEIGVDLETAMHNLSTLASATGPQGNSLLFSTVITQYENKLDALDQSIQVMESAFVDEVRVNRLGRAEPFLLHGGPHQVVAYRPAEMAAATCGDPQGYGTYPLPSNFERRLPSFNLYNLADYLKLGKLAVCLSDEWLNPVEYCYPPDPERPNEPPVCYTLAQHKSILTTYFDGFPIMSQTIVEDGETVPEYGADRWTRDTWLLGSGDYKAKFEAHSLIDQPSPEVAAQRATFLKTTTAKLETTFAGYQKELYGRILNELTTGSLQPLSVEAAGSKMLLNSLVTLGLSRAVGSDEFLYAMLFGNQQLVDDSQIAQSYSLSLTQPITGVNLMVNPRLLIEQEADERSAAFAGLIDKYLDAITAKTYVEAPDYIVNTRRALNLTVRIVQLEPAGASNQTISFNPLLDKLLGDPPFSVNATATSGLPVSFASLTSAICTVSGNTVTLIATGTCMLQATQAGNASFKPARPVTQSFAVKSTEKSDQSITFAKPADSKVTDLPFTLNASASSGLMVSFTSNSPDICMVSGDTVTLLATGTCSITATQDGNGTINPATPVVQSFTVSPQIGGSGGEQEVYLPSIDRYFDSYIRESLLSWCVAPASALVVRGCRCYASVANICWL